MRALPQLPVWGFGLSSCGRGALEFKAVGVESVLVDAFETFETLRFQACGKLQEIEFSFLKGLGSKIASGIQGVKGSLRTRYFGLRACALGSKKQSAIIVLQFRRLEAPNLTKKHVQ